MKRAWIALPTVVLLSTMLVAQAQPAPGPPPQPQQPEFIRQGNQLARDGKLQEALDLFQKHISDPKDEYAAHVASGNVLDLMGKGEDARKQFAEAAAIAPTPQAKAQASRATAMSYAFEGNCAKAVEFENKVLDFYKAEKNFFQQGEVSDEAARVCLDTGDLDTAYKLYKQGHDLGLQEPDIKPDRVDLWNFRWEHAQARIAARRGNKGEAEKHVAAAKSILDKGTNPQQAQFFPYLVGYVALYTGDLKTALDQLQKANQNDPFIQCLIGETYEKMGDKDKATEYYKKAGSTTAHNPTGAYAKRMTKGKV